MSKIQKMKKYSDFADFSGERSYNGKTFYGVGDI